MLIRLQRSIPSKIGSLKTQIFSDTSLHSTLKKAAFLLFLGLVVLYSFLPTLLNDYSWIPGDDHKEYLAHLRDFPDPIRYYGTLPAKLLPFSNELSLRIYYYSTPILVFFGLLVVFSRQGLSTSILSFLILFFMTSVILQDMEAGTFVGVIGFYTVFLPSLYLICKYNPNKLTITFLLTLGVLFHTTTGTFLMLGYIISKVRRPKDLLPLIPSTIIAIIWGVFFFGSTAQVLDAPNYTYTPPMELVLFLKQYLGVTTFGLLGVIFLFCYNTSKLYALKDNFVYTLLALIVVFLFLSFFPYFHLNSDRLSKFAVGLLVVTFCYTLGRAYNITIYHNPKAKLYIDLGIASILAILLYNTFNSQLAYWLSMGI